MTSFLDPARAAAVLERESLDGLLALTLDNVQYLTGFRPWHAGVSGGAAVLEPSGERTLVVGAWEAARAAAQTRADGTEVFEVPTWIEIDDLEALQAGRTAVRPKPVQLDLAVSADVVAAALRRHGLSRGRIGVELDALTAAEASALAGAAPEVELVDASGAFYDLRAVKHPAEIDLLRRATRVADAGLDAVLGVDPRGRTVQELRTRYAAAVHGAALQTPEFAGLTALRADVTAGGDVAPATQVDGRRIEDGQTLWVDYGAELHGYGSDAGRSYAIGEPHPWSERILEALAAGHAAGVPLLRAGTPASEVFYATQAAVRDAGLPTYTRGHVGHAAGLGLDEQGPFLAPTELRPLEPGMVVCFETPYYVRGLGGHQIEDIYVITGDGAERLTPRPHGLVRL